MAEAVSEIRKVARGDGILGAEGAVQFLERVSPALEHVNSSSGAIGSAVNRAIRELVPIIGRASAGPILRNAWLERLWTACSWRSAGRPGVRIPPSAIDLVASRRDDGGRWMLDTQLVSPAVEIDQGMHQPNLWVTLRVMRWAVGQPGMR